MEFSLLEFKVRVSLLISLYGYLSAAPRISSFESSATPHSIRSHEVKYTSIHIRDISYPQHSMPRPPRKLPLHDL